jgi:hypothetical protein
VELFAAVAEGVGEHLRRAVARGEKLPVRLPGRYAERRDVFLELEVERVAEELADVSLVAPGKGLLGGGAG